MLWNSLNRGRTYPDARPPVIRFAQEVQFGSGDFRSQVLFSTSFRAALAAASWRRLRDWQASGVWERLHLALLTHLREHDQIDWSRASIDGAAVASPRGASRLARTPRIAENSAANAISS